MRSWQGMHTAAASCRRVCLAFPLGPLLTAPRPTPPGTSPLYAYQSVFTSMPSPADIVSAASLFFWTLTLIVLVKYVGIILRFDDNGEGARRRRSHAPCSRACARVRAAACTNPLGAVHSRHPTKRVQPPPIPPPPAGGTFALYSLICRACGFGPFGPARPVDMHFKGAAAVALGRLPSSLARGRCWSLQVRCPATPSSRAP